MALDEEPLLLFVPGLPRARIPPTRSHHRVPAAQLESEYLDIGLARAHGVRRFARRIGYPVDAAVPHDDLAGAVVALGNDAFEIAILDRMVLDHHGEPFVGGSERSAPGHRP